MASIQRIKSPLTGEISYRAQVRVKGRPSESKSFTNQKDAKAWAAALETAIADNRNFPGRRAQRASFSELVQRYRDTVMKDMRSSNKASREQHLSWWDQRFLGLTIAEVTADKIAEARDALMAETFSRGKERKDKNGNLVPPKQYKRSGSTVNRYLATLSHLYSMAWKEWRLVQSNPLREVTKKREPKGRTRFLRDTERDALLDACAKSQWPGLHTLVLLALSTGARRGELINLRWENVDVKAGHAIVTETKNDDARTLPLRGKTLEALRALRLQGGGRSQFVFPALNDRDEPYVNFDGYWRDAVSAAGIENFHFHDLRHSFASMLAAQGASLLELADALGHRSIQMVRRNAHLTQSHKFRAIEKMVQERGL